MIQHGINNERNMVSTGSIRTYVIRITAPRLIPVTFFLLVLFSLGACWLTNPLQAQYIPLVEESKYWIYYDFQERPRPTTGFLITMQGDTLHQNTWYKKVYAYALSGEVKTIAIQEPPQFVAHLPYQIRDKKLVSLIREDVQAKKIYNLPIPQDTCIDSNPDIINPCNDIIFCDSAEHVLFDFSLEAGDTLNYCSYAPMHYGWEIQPEIVDSISQEWYAGKLRKTFYTVGVPSYLPNLINPGQNPAGIVKIMEGLGFKNQGIFHYRFGQLVEFCEGDMDLCHIISGTQNPVKGNPKVLIYPNPATEEISIQSDQIITNISLVDLHGIERIRTPYPEKLDLGTLVPGMYTCHISFEDGKKIFKKIIKI